MIGVLFPNGATPTFWVIAAYPGRPTPAEFITPGWFGVELAFEYANPAAPNPWNSIVACSEQGLVGPPPLSTPQTQVRSQVASSYGDPLVPAIPILGFEATFQAAGITTHAGLGTWNWASNPITLTVR